MRLRCDVNHILDLTKISMGSLGITSFLQLLETDADEDECRGNYDSSRPLTCLACCIEYSGCVCVLRFRHETQGRRDYEQTFPDMLAFDLNQNPSQRARKCGSIMFSITTGCSHVWIRHARRYITGDELLSLHSIPVRDDVARIMKCRPTQMTALSNTAKCFMAGNSIHGASVGKAFAILMLYSTKTL